MGSELQDKSQTKTIEKIIELKIRSIMLIDFSQVILG